MLGTFSVPDLSPPASFVESLATATSFPFTIAIEPHTTFATSSQRIHPLPFSLLSTLLTNYYSGVGAENPFE